MFSSKAVSDSVLLSALEFSLFSILLVRRAERPREMLVHLRVQRSDDERIEWDERLVEPTQAMPQG